MPLPVTFANLPTGNNPASLLDQEFAAVAAMGTTYCTATGTNTILLTVAPNQPTPTGYANGQQFSFLAPASNTGAVTIQVGSLAAIPLRGSGAQLSAGALTAGITCDVVISGNGTTADLIGGGGIKGTSTNDSAPAGFVGEIISSNVVSPGATMATAVTINITSISLPPGDWDVHGELWFQMGTGGATVCQGAITLGSATMPGNSAINAGRSLNQIVQPANVTSVVAIRTTRISTAATIPVYLVAQMQFSSGTCTCYGNIWARRAR